MMRRSRIGASVIFLLSVTMPPSSVRAWCQSYSVAQSVPGECVATGVPLMWQRPCVGYAVDSRVPSDSSYAEVLQVVTNAFDRWTGVECNGESIDLNATAFEASNCDRAEYNRSGGNVNTVAFVNDWSDRRGSSGEPFDPQAVAITVTWFKEDGEILDADILVNEDFGPFGHCDPQGCVGADLGRIDLESVLTHEVGHFFGMAHSSLDDTAMYFQSTRGSVEQRFLKADDIEGICTVYPPGTLPPECSSTPVGGLRLSCDDGRVVGACALGHAGVPRAVLIAYGLLVLYAFRRSRFERGSTT